MIDVAGDAGTAFDGQHLFQLVQDRITWIDGELWHGTWEGDESDLRRVDPRTGEVLERLEMPPGVPFRGSSPMAAIYSSAEEEGAAR